jgi:hypothetical protein
MHSTVDVKVLGWAFSDGKTPSDEESCLWGPLSAADAATLGAREECVASEYQ